MPALDIIIAAILAQTPAAGEGPSAAQAAPPPRQGSYIDGARLYEVCRETDNPHILDAHDVCIAYIAGVFDHIKWVESVMKIKLICAPRGEVPLGQAAEIVTKHLEENPETRHMAAASKVGLALERAFPCPRPTGKGKKNR